MKIYFVLAVLIAFVTIVAAQQNAVVVVVGTAGNNVSGIVRFQQQSDGAVRVVGKIFGLKANTKHGFHIHQDGDITDPAGLSTGGHFNPAGVAHACPNGVRHAGDLGNIAVDAKGEALYDENTTGLSLSEPKTSIIGRGLIVHADVDDCVTQPTGNAGARLGQGVVGICEINCQTRFNIDNVHDWKNIDFRV